MLRTCFQGLNEIYESPSLVFAPRYGYIGANIFTSAYRIEIPPDVGSRIKFWSCFVQFIVAPAHVTRDSGSVLLILECSSLETLLPRQGSHRTLGKISAHQYFGDTQSFGDVSELYLVNIFLAKYSANTAPLDSVSLQYKHPIIRINR
jgi:hypothetical protein